MKYIITLTQYELIKEHELRMNDAWADSDKAHAYNQGSINAVKELRRLSPTLFDTAVMFSLWFIPFGGTILSGMYGSAVGYTKMKKGAETGNKMLQIEGLIDLLTGPTSLGTMVFALKKLGHKGNKVQMLNKIHKSGLLVLTSSGWNQFLNWGAKEFGDEFLYFTKILGDKKMLEQVLMKK